MTLSVNKDEEQEEVPYTLVLSVINMKGCMLCNTAILLLGTSQKNTGEIPTRIICNGGKKKRNVIYRINCGIFKL